MGMLDGVGNAAHFPQFGFTSPRLRLFARPRISLSCIRDLCLNTNKAHNTQDHTLANGMGWGEQQQRTCTDPQFDPLQRISNIAKQFKTRRALRRRQ